MLVRPLRVRQELDPAYRREPVEFVLLRQVPCGDNDGASPLDTTMGLLLSFGMRRRCSGGGQHGFGIGDQSRLIILELEGIVGPGCAHRLCRLAMTVQRIAGDHAACEAQQLEQIESCLHLIAIRCLGLCEHHAGGDGPGRDHQRRHVRAALLVAALEALAVDRNDARRSRDAGGLAECLHEAGEHLAEGLRVEQTKYPAEGVVAWDAVLECEDTAQQSLLSVCPESPCVAGIFCDSRMVA